MERYILRRHLHLNSLKKKKGNTTFSPHIMRNGIINQGWVVTIVNQLKVPKLITFNLTRSS